MILFCDVCGDVRWDWTWRDTAVWSKVMRDRSFNIWKCLGKPTRCTGARRVDWQVWSSFQSAGVWILADSGLKMMYTKNICQDFWSIFCWAHILGQLMMMMMMMMMMESKEHLNFEAFWTFKDRGHTSQCCRASQWDGWGRWAWILTVFFSKNIFQWQMGPDVSCFGFGDGNPPGSFTMGSTCGADSLDSLPLDAMSAIWARRRSQRPELLKQRNMPHNRLILLTKNKWGDESVTRYDEKTLWHDTYHDSHGILYWISGLEAQMATNSAQNVQALARQLNRRQAVQRHATMHFRLNYVKFVFDFA